MLPQHVSCQNSHCMLSKHCPDTPGATGEARAEVKVFPNASRLRGPKGPWWHGEVYITKALDQKISIDFLKSTYPSQRVNLHILQISNASSTCTVMLWCFNHSITVVGDLKGAQETWIATGLSPERVCFDCSGDCLSPLHLKSTHVLWCFSAVSLAITNIIIIIHLLRLHLRRILHYCLHFSKNWIDRMTMDCVDILPFQCLEGSDVTFVSEEPGQPALRGRQLSACRGDGLMWRLHVV